MQRNWRLRLKLTKTTASTPSTAACTSPTTLSFLRSLNDECIDLVCIDPPFAKNDTFTGDRIRPALSAEERQIERRLLAGWGVTNAREADAAGIVWPDGDLQGGYRDIWSWEGDIHEEWLTSIEEDYPAIHAMIEGTRLGHSDSHAAYLCYMAIRLLEIHRALKPTGSLFLHCDATAGAYLYELLDIIFGADNHVNQIVWKRTSSHNDARRFGTITDYILFYAKTDQRTWNHVLVPHDPAYVSRNYRHEDERGQYRLHEIIRTASMGPRPNLSYEYQGYTPQYGWRMERNRLEALDREGRLVWSETGRPYRKTYLPPGRYAVNLWGRYQQSDGAGQGAHGLPHAEARRPRRAHHHRQHQPRRRGAGLLRRLRLCRRGRGTAGTAVGGLRLQSQSLDGVQAPVQQAKPGPAALQRRNHRPAGAGPGFP